MLKSKFKIFIIFLVLFISIGAISASEDVSLSSVSDGGDMDLIENTENVDVDQDYSLSYDDSAVDLDSSVSTDDVVIGDSCEIDEVDLDALSTEDGDDYAIDEVGLDSSISSNDLGDSAKTFGDIQSLVDSAEVDDTILLNGTYESSGNEIEVSKSLTIDGQGVTTLDAKGKSSIFTIDAPAVTLRNITFVGCSGEHAVLFKGTNIIIKNCTFKNNHAGSGSALYMDSVNSSSIVDCVFTQNSATYDGGAIYIQSGNYSTIRNCIFNHNHAMDGGAVHVTSKNSLISNSKFYSNSASYYDDIEGFEIIYGSGGAIYSSSNNSKIEKCNFTDNYAVYDGGAIYSNSRNQSSIVNCIFRRNNAMDGGAVHVTSKNSLISNSKFDSNSAFYQNEAWMESYNKISGKGGAIYSSSNNSKIEKCNFTNNSAIYNGGAIYVYSGSLTVSNSNFNKNMAENSGNVSFSEKEEYGNGGAIYFAPSSKNSLIDKCSFSSNKALKNGGAVHSSAPNLKIRNSNFKVNVAQNGGAIYNGGKNCLIYNSNFTKNQASSKGGAITWTANASGRINKCIFTQNTAKVDCGAIDGNVNNNNISNCKFNNNKSPREDDVYSPYALSVAKSGVYAGNVILTMKLYYLFTKKPVKNAKLDLTFINSKGKKTLKSFKTNAKGLVRYYVALPAGRYTVKFKAKSDLSNKVVITVKNFKAKLYASKLTTTYKSGLTYNVRMVNLNSKQRPTNVRVALRVYTGRKAQTLYALTRNGLARFDISSVAAGTHKVIVSSALNSAKASRLNSQLVIKKGNFVVSAPKVQNKLNKSGLFKVKVITKNTKKPAKALNVRIRIYTGKQYKTYTRKTNANGIASITTKSLTRGTHRVIVSSGDRNCAFNVKSSIVIVN